MKRLREKSYCLGFYSYYRSFVLVLLPYNIIILLLIISKMIDRVRVVEGVVSHPHGAIHYPGPHLDCPAH